MAGTVTSTHRVVRISSEEHVLAVMMVAVVYTLQTDSWCVYAC